jgi:hypothetical protein
MSVPVMMIFMVCMASGTAHGIKCFLEEGSLYKTFITTVIPVYSDFLLPHAD